MKRAANTLSFSAAAMQSTVGKRQKKNTRTMWKLLKILLFNIKAHSYENVWKKEKKNHIHAHRLPYKVVKLSYKSQVIRGWAVACEGSKSIIT